MSPARATVLAAMNGGANRVNAAWLVLGMLLGLLALCAVLVSGWTPRPRLLRSGAALLLLAAWSALVSSLLRQNGAALARLVPGHAAALRRPLLGAWCLLCGSGLLASALWAGDPLQLGLPFAAALLLMAWAQRHPGLWALGLLLALGLPLGPDLGWPPGWLTTTSAASAWMAGALLLPAGCLLLLPLIQQGGRRHRHSQRRLMRWREARALDSSIWAYVLQPANWGWWGRPSRQLYARALSRQSARRGQQASADWLLALGPALHWSAALAGLGLVASAWLALLVVTSVLARLELVELGRALAPLSAIATGLSLGLLMGSSLQMRRALLATRTEQGLLRLTPGTPQGAAMNRVLAGRLMLNHLLCWVSLLACLLLLSQRQQLLAPLLIYLLCALNELWLLCRDWSRVERSRRLPTLALLIAGIGLGGLPLFYGLPLWQIALPMLVFTGAMTAWRWSRLTRWPAALPVGRH